MAETFAATFVSLFFILIHRILIHARKAQTFNKPRAAKGTCKWGVDPRSVTRIQDYDWRESDSCEGMAKPGKKAKKQSAQDTTNNKGLPIKDLLACDVLLATGTIHGANFLYAVTTVTDSEPRLYTCQILWL